MKILVFILACILALAFGLVFWIRNETADIVTITPLAEELSPDKAWKATVEEVYSEGLMMTDVVSQVTLVSTKHSGKVVNILGVDTGGHRDEGPQISWVSLTVLRVTIPNLSFLKLNRCNYGGVRIDLRFDPDDPVARAAWHKQLNEAVPNPSCG